MTCPNGCTDIDTDTPLEMEFDFIAEKDNKPGYRCPNPTCGWAELQSERGRL